MLLTKEAVLDLLKFERLLIVKFSEDCGCGVKT
jgi:hypothetical protein